MIGEFPRDEALMRSKEKVLLVRMIYLNRVQHVPARDCIRSQPLKNTLTRGERQRAAEVFKAENASARQSSFRHVVA